jgi:uncharacterized protein (DUF302 family)
MSAPSSQLPFAVSTSPVRTLHRSVAIDVPFERFTQALEKVVGHVPTGWELDIVSRPTLARERLKAAEGPQGLMIFTMFDHGAALNMAGARRNAKQYLIGNALTAISMTQHDIRAALYAPLRVLVYERNVGRTVVEYDQPSSQFGQFSNGDVTNVGVMLDSELEEALAQAAESSRT